MSEVIVGVLEGLHGESAVAHPVVVVVASGGVVVGGSDHSADALDVDVGLEVIPELGDLGSTEGGNISGVLEYKARRRSVTGLEEAPGAGLAVGEGVPAAA
jgi:hypothetical protein